VTKILIILSFVFCFIGGIQCAAPDAVQLRKETVRLIDTEKQSRFIDGAWHETIIYYYRSDDGIIYQTFDDLGKIGVVWVRR
jgi:hypothetical protein